MKPIFRNSMFGFHKEDVASFIAKQNQQFDSKLAELQSKLDAQAKDFARREQELICDQEDLENLRSEKNAYKTDVSKIIALAERFSSESEVLNKALDECRSSVEDLDKELDSARERLEQSDAFREKAEKFDRLASVLGEIVSGKAPEEAGESVAAEPVLLPSSDKAFLSIEKEREAAKKLQATCEELLLIVKRLEQKL